MIGKKVETGKPENGAYIVGPPSKFPGRKLDPFLATCYVFMVPLPKTNTITLHH